MAMDSVQAGSPSVGRLWALRALAFFGGIGALGLLLWFAVTHDMPMILLLSLTTAVIVFAVCIAVFAEVTFREEGLADRDAGLVHRLKTSSARHVGVIAVAAPLMIDAWWLARVHFHLTMLETLLLLNVPSIAVNGIARWLWPVSAGTQADTVRASLLMVDRLRRQQAFSYAMFAGLLALNLLMVAPLVWRACEGQPIRLVDFDVLGIGGFIALIFLSQPWNWFERRAVRAVLDDESLVRFRMLAFRNGFFVMAAGLVGLCDAVRSPPRLAVTLIPVVLCAGMMVSLLTMVWLEYQAGTFRTEDENAGAADRNEGTFLRVR